MNWNQPVELDSGQRARWTLGPRRIWAERRPGEWRIGHADTGREDATTIELDNVIDEADGLMLSRVAASGSTGSVQLTPRPPDRPVIARSEITLVVPPGASTRVYVGVPLWVAVMSGTQQLADIPLLDLSDTWFGSPLEGTLCYATRTHLTIDEALIPRRTHRAVCTAEIVNHGLEPLELRRLRIPAPMLSLWRADDGALWTDPIRIERDAGEDTGNLTILDGGARASSKRLADARQPRSTGRVVRVFNAVWKNFGGST